MTSPQALLDELVLQVPMIGAVVGDFEGETVVAALGEQQLSASVLASANSHIPQQMSLSMSPAMFLLRLAGAESSALLHQLREIHASQDGGAVRNVEWNYCQLRYVFALMPEDYWILVVQPSSTPAGALRWRLRSLAPRMADSLGL